MEKQTVAGLLLAKDWLAACFDRELNPTRVYVTLSPFFLVAVQPPHFVAATHPVAQDTRVNEPSHSGVEMKREVAHLQASVPFVCPIDSDPSNAHVGKWPADAWVASLAMRPIPICERQPATQLFTRTQHGHAMSFLQSKRSNAA